MNFKIFTFFNLRLYLLLSSLVATLIGNAQAQGTCGDPKFQYETVSASRDKCGFQELDFEYLPTDSPIKHYLNLTAVENNNGSGPNYVYKMSSNVKVLTSRPSCASSSTGKVDFYTSFPGTMTSGKASITNSATAAWSDGGELIRAMGWFFIGNDDYTWDWGVDGITFDGSTNATVKTLTYSHDASRPGHNSSDSTTTLDTEYTDSDVRSDAVKDLGDFPNTWSGGGATNAYYIFDGPHHETVKVQKMQYRIAISCSVKGMDYKMGWYQVTWDEYGTNMVSKIPQKETITGTGDKNNPALGSAHTVDVPGSLGFISETELTLIPDTNP